MWWMEEESIAERCCSCKQYTSTLNSEVTSRKSNELSLVFLLFYLNSLFCSLFVLLQINRRNNICCSNYYLETW